MRSHARSRGPQTRLPGVAILLALTSLIAGVPLSAQRITIPYLANATKPDDLDFAAAQCDLASNGELMTCRFRQIFLTVPTVDASACVIVTNGFERTFRRETSARWVNTSAPDGVCGVVETTTLDDSGGTRWTMTIRRGATLQPDRPECQSAPPAPEVYDWRNVKRTLPCTSVQPGAIER